MNVTDLDYETVRTIIQRWPTTMRITLIHDILDTLAKQEPRDTKRGTLERARGLLSTDRPAPTDEEVERMLEEHRMEKYD